MRSLTTTQWNTPYTQTINTMKLAALILAAGPALASAFLAPASLQRPVVGGARGQGALRMVVADDFKLDAALVRFLTVLTAHTSGDERRTLESKKLVELATGSQPNAMHTHRLIDGRTGRQGG